MSKERLEEFREFIDFMYESVDIEDHQRFIAISETMIKDGWFKWVYRYAKEQAERVEELEKVEYALQETYRQEREYNKKLEQQNKHYRVVIKKAIDDLESECLWDALVALKELEGDEELRI